MKALINADELANDVAGAEALLDRHQEHKVKHFPKQSFSVQVLMQTSFVQDDFKCFDVFQGEIDAHEDSFRGTDEAGKALLSTGHYASEEVKEKVKYEYKGFMFTDLY